MASTTISLTFLTVPLEIRELVYDMLFSSRKQVFVTAAPQHENEDELQRLNNSTTWSVESGTWAMTPQSMSSQLLRVNRQIHSEALPFLYSQRIFDLTARDTLKILMRNVGPTNFSNIKHVTIEWDELQQFAWELKKPEYILGLSGLNCVQLATWRHRHMYGTSVQWRSVKDGERTLLQAALEITEKHENLNILAEEPFRRKSSAVQMHTENVASHRVRWRFVASKDDLKPGEVAVDIEKDLEAVKVTKQEAEDVGFSLPINDLI